MENEIIEDNDSDNVEEVEAEAETEEVVEVEEEEVVEEEVVEEELDYKAEVERLKKENQTLKIQKAKIKEKGETHKDVPSQEISQFDLYALMQKNVAQEDIQEVIDYSKLKGISIQQALESTLIKATLAEKEEERKTANASSTGTAKRSQREVSGDVLLENARNNKLPESDSDLSKLIDARMEAKRNRRK